MKFKKPTCFCEKCVEKLARKSTSLVRVWIEICDSYMEYFLPLIFKEILGDSSCLEFLEKNGFIVTHETSTHLLVRPLGFHQARPSKENIDFFCINLEDHEKDY